MQKTARERGLLLPMLCQNGGEDGAAKLDARGWVYELKLDGVRILADKRGREADLWYRSGRCATREYPEIARAVAELPIDAAVLDGEILALDEAGKPSFQRLGQRFGVERERDVTQLAKSVPVIYVVFDLIALGERDLRALPLLERRRLLEAFVPQAGAATKPDVCCLDYLADDGTALFEMCRREHLEGVVAKRAASPYRSGERSGDWLKIKCERDEDFVVVGFTRGTGSRAELGALDIATYEEGALVVRGKVGSGLDDATLRALVPRLRALAVDAPVARGDYQSAPRGRTHVRPEIVVRVRVGSWTEDGRVRFPVFQGVRHDVEPGDCCAAPPGNAARRAELDAYYDAVGETLLRYLRGRSVIASMEQLRATAPPLRARIAADGAPGGTWAAFDSDAAGALALRARVEGVGLSPFVKAGEALEWQIIVPLGDAPPEGARAFTELLAHLVTTDLLAAQARGDRTRHAASGVVRAASGPIVAPYSPLAHRAGWRVSAPVRWEELAAGLRARELTPRAVAARVATMGDVMAPIMEANVDFPRAVARIDASIGGAQPAGGGPNSE